MSNEEEIEISYKLAYLINSKKIKNKKELIEYSSDDYSEVHEACTILKIGDDKHVEFPDSLDLTKDWDSKDGIVFVEEGNGNWKICKLTTEDLVKATKTTNKISVGRFKYHIGRLIYYVRFLFKIRKDSESSEPKKDSLDD